MQTSLHKKTEFLKFIFQHSNEIIVNQIIELKNININSRQTLSTTMFQNIVIRQTFSTAIFKNIGNIVIELKNIIINSVQTFLTTMSKCLFNNKLIFCTNIAANLDLQYALNRVKKILQSKKIYHAKPIESLIDFANFILVDNQFIVDIRN